jgi:pimeloyl-ACP methyl ester carboxylesterase
MPYSTETGVRIHYQTAGEGPAMVLVHANPFDLNLWLYQIAHFSTWFRVIAPDIRGYGRSDKVTASYTLEDMAADIVGVCRREGITEAIVGGISVGSGIAMMMALEHPSLVRALILVGGASARPTSYDARIRGYEQDGVVAYQRGHIAQCFAPGFADTKRGRYLTDMFTERGPRLDGKAIGQVFRARGAAHLTPRLATLSVPALVVNGEHDMSLAEGRVTAAAIPGAWHRELKDAGHCCNIEDPAAFDEAVVEFLADHGLMPPL